MLVLTYAIKTWVLAKYDEKEEYSIGDRNAKVPFIDRKNNDGIRNKLSASLRKNAKNSKYCDHTGRMLKHHSQHFIVRKETRRSVDKLMNIGGRFN